MATSDPSSSTVSNANAVATAINGAKTDSTTTHTENIDVHSTEESYQRPYEHGDVSCEQQQTTRTSAMEGTETSSDTDTLPGDHDKGHKPLKSRARQSSSQSWAAELVQAKVSLATLQQRNEVRDTAVVDGDFSSGSSDTRVGIYTENHLTNPLYVVAGIRGNGER